MYDASPEGDTRTGRLAIGASYASLLLVGVLLGIHLMTYEGGHNSPFPSQDTWISVCAHAGTLQVTYYARSPRDELGAGVEPYYVDGMTQDQFKSLGPLFEWRMEQAPAYRLAPDGSYSAPGSLIGYARRYRVRVPLSLCLLGALVCPFARAAAGTLRSFKHVRRLELGLCVKCGFDLRGAVEARCSECGLLYSPERRDQDLGLRPSRYVGVVLRCACILAVLVAVLALMPLQVDTVWTGGCDFMECP